MKLGRADTDQGVAIVAEIGNNHEGNFEVAQELVRAAALAGADAVKFQAIDPARLVDSSDPARLAQLEGFQLSPEQFGELAELARSLELGFLCTPFSLKAVDWLAPLVDAFKIASGDNDYLLLLEAVAATGKPVIVSSGMTDVSGLRRAQSVFDDREFAVLHCVSAYPTPLEAARLATIPVLARELGCTVGFSDHTLGLEACHAAVALGARILEKHFTLRNDFSEFRDHQLSADPDELRRLADGVKRVQAVVGRPRDRAVLAEEEAVAAVARRSAVAARDLQAGQVLELDDLEFLRPAGPVPADTRFVGQVLRHARRTGEHLQADDLQPRS